MITRLKVTSQKQTNFSTKPQFSVFVIAYAKKFHFHAEKNMKEKEMRSGMKTT